MSRPEGSGQSAVLAASIHGLRSLAENWHAVALTILGSRACGRFRGRQEHVRLAGDPNVPRRSKAQRVLLLRPGLSLEHQRQQQE